VSEWGPYPIAVLWCSCAWFAGLTLYVCYWIFCHPPTPGALSPPTPRPEHYAFLYPRPHVSENGGLGFKVVWQRTHHKKYGMAEVTL
jgi:hypothetical protein